MTAKYRVLGTATCCRHCQLLCGSHSGKEAVAVAVAVPHSEATTSPTPTSESVSYPAGPAAAAVINNLIWPNNTVNSFWGGNINNNVKLNKKYSITIKMKI